MCKYRYIRVYIDIFVRTSKHVCIRIQRGTHGLVPWHKRIPHCSRSKRKRSTSPPEIRTCPRQAHTATHTRKRPVSTHQHRILHCCTSKEKGDIILIARDYCRLIFGILASLTLAQPSYRKRNIQSTENNAFVRRTTNYIHESVSFIVHPHTSCDQRTHKRSKVRF